MLKWSDKIEGFTVTGGRRGRIARMQAMLDNNTVRVTLDDYAGKDAADEEQRRLAAARKAIEEEIEKCRKTIAFREAHPEFKINILHIGTADEPEACDVLRATQSASRFDARRRTRLALVEKDGPAAATEDAISTALARDKARLKEVAAEVRAWVEAGTEPGTYARLFALGGPALVADASVDVQECQTLTEEMGEG